PRRAPRAWVARARGPSLSRRVGRRAIHQTAEDLLVRLLDTAEILPEAVLVELRLGRRIPQPARVGRDLVAQVECLAGPTELELEVDQHEPPLFQMRHQQAVHLEGGALEPG